MKTTYLLNLRRFLLAAAFLAGLGGATPASAKSYLIDLNSRTATELGTLGGNYSVGTDINDLGQVVGYSATTLGFAHAFITGPDGAGMRDLGTLGGNESRASAINAAGQVVGASGGNAFLTGPNGVDMRFGGGLGGRSAAYGINDAGWAAGGSVTVHEEPGGLLTHAWLTRPDNRFVRDLSGNAAISSTAYDINDPGQVVGVIYYAPFGENHAFITGPDGAGMRELGTLGGRSSFAYAINDAGQVAGQSDMTEEASTGTVSHAFITGLDGMGMRDLGTLGGNDSLASAINAAGQVAGWSETSEGDHHAFVTGPDGAGMIDLNSLADLPKGTILTEAVGINNAGQVIASATAIPEPETYALLLSGLVLIGAIVWRKKDIGPLPA